MRITYRGAELAARAFAKDGAVTQATVVENKLLGGALEEIRQKQLVRDTQKLRSRSMNRRGKEALSRSIEARVADNDDGIRGTPTVDSILRDALEAIHRNGFGRGAPSRDSR